MSKTYNLTPWSTLYFNKFSNFVGGNGGRVKITSVDKTLAVINISSFAFNNSTANWK